MTNTKLIEELRNSASETKLYNYRNWKLLCDAAEALEAAPHWISVKDKFPPLNEEVLVVWDSGRVGTADLLEHKTCEGAKEYLWEDDYGSFIDADDALWWMPIPKIPEENK